MSNNPKFHPIRFNLEIISNQSVMNYTNTQLMNYFSSVQDNNFIYLKSRNITGNSFPFNQVIFQSECDPPKIFGIVIMNYIYQIYVKSENLIKKFNKIVLELLYIIRSCYLFCFTNRELRFIKQILPFKLRDEQVNISLEFLKELKIVNVQSRNDEGLIPALFSIGEKPYNNLILRDEHDTNLYFKHEHYDRILEHNVSVLLSILKLVKTRFLKLMLW